MKKALLCVGNKLRGDDGVALEVGKIAKKELKSWKIFFGNDMPENEFASIRAFEPDILVVVDAVCFVDTNLNDKSNICEFIDLSDEVSYFYNAHNIPTSVWIKYLREFVPKILFLGISVEMSNLMQIKENLSQKAKENARLAVEKIKILDSELL